MLFCLGFAFTLCISNTCMFSIFLAKTDLNTKNWRYIQRQTVVDNVNSFNSGTEWQIYKRQKTILPTQQETTEQKHFTDARNIEHELFCGVSILISTNAICMPMLLFMYFITMYFW